MNSGLGGYSSSLGSAGSMDHGLGGSSLGGSTFMDRDLGSSGLGVLSPMSGGMGGPMGRSSMGGPMGRSSMGMGGSMRGGSHMGMHGS